MTWAAPLGTSCPLIDSTSSFITRLLRINKTMVSEILQTQPFENIFYCTKKDFGNDLGKTVAEDGAGTDLCNGL